MSIIRFLNHILQTSMVAPPGKGLDFLSNILNFLDNYFHGAYLTYITVFKLILSSFGVSWSFWNCYFQWLFTINVLLIWLTYLWEQVKFMVEFFSPKQCKSHLAVKSVFFTLELESLGTSRRGWPRLQKGSATSPERSAWGEWSGGHFA